MGIFLMMIAALYGVLYIAPDINLAVPSETEADLDSMLNTSVADSMMVYYHPFDPNTVDSLTLLHLSWKPVQIHSLLQYRRHGGVFRKAEDLLKLYCMDSELFSRIQPYVSIAPLTEDLRRDSIRHYWHMRDSLWHDSVRLDSLRRDSIYHSQYHHPKVDTLIELNQADTDDLQYIRGIGRYTAIQIVRYRQDLGGYCSTQQLQEVPGLEFVHWDSIVPHLWADRDSVHPIPVNRAGIERLKRHPYIRMATAKSIYTLRRQHLRLRNMEQLESVLAPEEVERLRPYLDFSD